MANDVTRNPWILDTVATVWGTTAAPLPLKVDHFEFFAYALDTDQVILKDLDGKIIWQDNGADDLKAVRSGGIGWLHRGLKVDTLTAGAKVAVYVL